MPKSVPKYTDWVWLENNNIGILDGEEYIKTIKFLNLNKNIISTVTAFFITKVHESKNMKWLNLAQNKLFKIPKKIQNLKRLEKVWLSGNRFHCDCDMVWMVGWLNNFTTTLGEHVIVDYQDIKCHNGKMKGKPIYLLDEVKLGCFPSKWTLKQELITGISGGFGLVIIITLSTLVIRKYNDIKFFFYHYFKWCICIGVARDDKNEVLDNMEYDAFLYYR